MSRPEDPGRIECRRLNPRALAAELTRIAGELGLHPRIACIEGDDLMGRLGDLQAAGEAFTHMDKGIALRIPRGSPSPPTPTSGVGVS